MISAKMATPDLLKITFFWRKGYEVIYSAYDVTNKILSRNSNFNVIVVMWTKFGNSSICIREVIITSILKVFNQKNCFFEGWSWFKLNTWGLVLGMDLKFYTSVEKGLKLKVRKVWRLILTFAEVLEEKLVGGPLCPPLFLILDRVKDLRRHKILMGMCELNHKQNINNEYI